MSFRKRNSVIGVAGTTLAPAVTQRQEQVQSPGTRPSPHDGRLTTSTGTSSLDQLLAGHGGLPMGTSLLLEETGTTDYGGILQRYFAAEGLVQGHHVHVLGPGEFWRRELPGLSSSDVSVVKNEPPVENKMKIAWRYEALNTNRSTQLRGSGNGSGSNISDPAAPGSSPFRHSFDLSKRLEDSVISGQLHTLSTMDHHAQASPTQTQTQTMFQRFISDVTSRLEISPPTSVHRIVVPGLLSPTIHPSSASHPHQVLQFLHSLRGLLRRFASRLTALVSMPISLYPRSTGLTRRMELLSDGVIEIIPFQHQGHTDPSSSNSSKEQGLLRVHSLPVFHEKGGGLDGSWVKEDMSFKLSASSGLIITPFSLPPLLDDQGEQDQASSRSNDKQKKSLDF